MNNKEHDMEVMRKYFERHENVTIGLTFNSKAYLISEYLQELDKNDFRLIGYDLLEQNVEFLKNGNNIQFLIAQQPHQQGYRAVTSLCDHLIFHKEVEQINYMPIDLLCAENIDYYTSLNK
jgi:LacI family transcriptional regulator